MRLFLYARRSRDDDLTVSTEEQVDACRRWADAHGHAIAAEYVDDDTSGTTTRRVAFEAMLAALERGEAEGVVAKKSDRFGRMDLLEWLLLLRRFKEAKQTLLFAEDTLGDDTADGLVLRNLKLTLNQAEAIKTGERIRASNRYRVQLGRHVGGAPPLGYAYDAAAKAISPSPRAADAAYVFSVFAQMSGNTRQAVVRLNREGVLTARGKFWHPFTLLFMLRSPQYRGLRRYAGVDYPAPDIPRIIPEELLARVDTLLALRSPRPGRRHTHARPLSGLLWCARCGSQKMHPHYSARGERVHYSWYCLGRYRGLCESREWAERRLEAALAERLAEALRPWGDYLAEALPGIAEEAALPQANPERSLLAERERLIRMAARGLISEDELAAHLERVAEDLRLVRETPPPAAPPTPDDVREGLALLEDEWYARPDDERRAMYLALVRRAWVDTTARTLRLDLAFPARD